MLKCQKGFTLIELLVVIAILGVIAAVVILNVNTFFGSGAVQAANVEFHQVQTAITAYLADNAPVVSFNGTIGPKSNYPEDAASNEGVHKYLVNPGMLQADYDVADGTAVNATPVLGSRWVALHFCGGQWQKNEC